MVRWSGPCAAVMAAWLLTACPPAVGSGSVALDSSAYSVGEGAGKVTVTVKRTGGTTGAATFELSTADGTARAGSDYTPITVSVSFADQDGSPKSVDVPILQDTLTEGSETFQIRLALKSGDARLGSPSEATVTIADDDSPTSAGVLSFAAAASTVVESAGQISLSVTRTGGSVGAVSAILSTADGTGTAGQDYTAVSTTVTFADGDSAPKTVAVPILQDTASEAIESFTANLTSPSGGATLGAVARTSVSILDDDGAPGFALDDTGVTTCASTGAAGLPCGSPDAGTSDFPRQDGETGRDATAADDRDGHAGFSFLKLDAAGVPLADQSVPYATNPWACVADRVTGLVWEVRTTDGGLRDRRWRYSWYGTSGLRGGAGRGRSNGGTCFDTSSCDTAKYVAAVNAAGLCGAADWRLPTRAELLSLVDYGAGTAPLIDASFLPDGTAESWWSATPDWTGRAWVVHFGTGATLSSPPFVVLPVRLVRGGG